MIMWLEAWQESLRSSRRGGGSRSEPFLRLCVPLAQQLRVARTTWTTVHPLIVRYAPRKPCSCEQTYMPLGRRFRSGTQSYLHHHAIVCIVYFARIEHQASLLLHPVSNRLAEDRNISTAKPPLQSTSNAAKEKKNNWSKQEPVYLWRFNA